MTSRFPKSPNAEGSNNLNMKSNIVTEIIVAISNHACCRIRVFFKKIYHSYSGNCYEGVDTIKDSPITKLINAKFPLLLSIFSSHLNPNQNKRAIIRVAIA